MGLSPLQVNGHVTADTNDILSGTILDSAGRGTYLVYAQVNQGVTDATLTVNDGRQIVVNGDHIPQGEATQPVLRLNELEPWRITYQGDSRPRIDIADGTNGEIEYKVIKAA
jgi:hypothetical protein